jgi:hypothetical protein
MNDKDERLGHLMTYTVFHIGVYISLFTALIGVGIFKDFDHWLLRFCVGCFLCAGVCEAVVGSNIPEHPNFESYSKTPIGPWGCRMFLYSTWATIEHLAFWLGILPIVGGFLIYGPAILKAD